MSFGFGGNNNTSTGFGGFGASNTGGGGFGANTNTTSAGGSLFGNTATSGGGFGGFGASNNQQSTGFGASKPFGAAATTTSGGGLFGGGTTTSGGFGAGANTGFGASTSGGFGSNTGGGLFGQNKPATGGFGASNAGGGLFGSGNNNTTTGTGGFGNSTTASNPFASNAGATTNTGFGAANTGGSAFGGFGASNNAVATANQNNNNGTAAAPFEPVQEKEANTSVMQTFQSITCQAPYKNKSFEELRVEDYQQGRRYGNTNGQAGAFGQSTGFGGFGQQQATTTGGGLFGAQNNTATSGSTFGGFGNTNNQNQTGGTGFGANANTGGGLFGQNKPATGGLFGNTAASSAPAANPFGGATSGSGGGLFGASNNTGGFGANTNTANTGGGLFGANNNNTQQNNAFGQSNTGGGLFGQQNKPATGGLFGGGANTTTGGGLFGSNNQTQQQSNPFGQSNNNAAGGLFGNNQNNQNKPAFGGFGASTNTGGAFGGGANTGGSLFGNNQAQSNTGGSLFGNNNNQNKPATGGLFGNSTNNNTGGLFGNSQNQQQNTGGSLFGGNTNQGSSLFGNNQNKPATGSLFGNTGASNTGGSLFSNSQSNQNTGGSSLFGNSTNQNQQGGNSLFGQSNNNQQQQQQQQPNQLHASLISSPYGNDQLLQAATSAPVGPLATPLNVARPAPRKTPSLMTSMRLNSPVYTPRGGGSLGRASGYGFSYSTYGTPGSAYSTASLTPGASSLLRPASSFNSALQSRLGKSISMGNLRGDGTPGERGSLLRESALSPPGTGGRFGSVRKLNIDRSLRTDLFGQQEQPAGRRVHYDGTAETPDELRRETEPKPSDRNALVRTETEDSGTQEEDQQSPAGLLKAAPQPPKPKQPEMSQVNGGGNGPLTTVPENSVPHERPGSAPATQQRPSKPAAPPAQDVEEGEFWTEPPIRHLKKMARSQLQKVGNFVVGRHGFGRVEFAPVDLSNTDLDRICGDIVLLEPRKATVYPDTMRKPPMGQGLNVPSTIYLENSWARTKGGQKAVLDRNSKEYAKHVRRLKRVEGTTYKDYDPQAGVWVFTVEHFTTYGLDDDYTDDEETELDGPETSGLSEPPVDETMDSIVTPTGEMDDTFEFKLERRSTKSLPGGFEGQGLSYDYDEPSADEGMEEDVQEEDSFRSSGGAVQAPSPGAVERYHSSILEDEEQHGDVTMNEQEEQSPEMPGAFAPEPKQLRSILKPTAGFSNAFASPEKLATDSWEDQLQRTMSPKKRDRQALKDMQQSLMKAKGRDGDAMESPFKQSMLGQSMMGQSALGQSYLAQKSAKKAKLAADGGKNSQAFRSSMDLMKSLWAEEKDGRKTGAGGKGFEYPYAKKPRLSATDELDEQDAAFHNSQKPSFSADGTLVYAAAGSAPQVSGDLMQSMRSIVGEHRDVRFAKSAKPDGLTSPVLELQLKTKDTATEPGGIPYVQSDGTTDFADLAAAAQRGMGTQPSRLEMQELAIWQLCSVFYDPLDVACKDFIDQVPGDLREQYAERLTRDAFVAFWSKLVTPTVDEQLKRAKSAEEKALLLLTKNDISGACDVLVSAKDYRLASLVAQLPSSEQGHDLMSQQRKAWTDRKDWSEMSDGIRGLYTLLGRGVTTVPGFEGPAEDRVEAFTFAERFSLTWQQSLAFHVFYGGYSTLTDAIQGYLESLEAGEQSVKPITLWDHDAVDDSLAETEDTLMSLTRLFAHGTAGVDIHAICDPLTISGNATNSRVAWQLEDMLATKDIASFSGNSRAQLTVDFATQLEAAGELIYGAWVLQHLEEDSERQAAVTGLLQRNANKIADPSEDQENNFAALTQDLGIPRSMVFAAKAMYAKAIGDLYAQARWLLWAGLLHEAHDVVCTFVGPQAVIEEEYEALADLIGEFWQNPGTSELPGWNEGGLVYRHLLRLLSLTYPQKHGQEGAHLVRELRKVLPSMEKGTTGKTLEQKVAISEIRRIVEETAKEIGSGGESKKRQQTAEVVSFGAGADMLQAYRSAMGAVV